MKKRLPGTLLAAFIVGFYAFYIPSNLGNPLDEWLSGLIRLLSYFTIQSNIMVGFVAVAAVMSHPPKWLKWWRGDSVKAAVSLYITVTGAVHFILLQGSIDYQGWQSVGNICHHYITPILMPLYWLLSRQPKTMSARNIPAWLVFPIVYLLYWLIRGPIVGNYPYFFLDVDKFGYGQVAINCALLTLFFSLLAGMLIAVDRKVMLQNRNGLA
ncbi:MAG: hypothetical protein ACI89U_001766 [Gammaproteobacteria bacterium]|jgi:hypothetical protein